MPPVGAPGARLRFETRRDRRLDALGDVVAIRELVGGTVTLAGPLLELRWAVTGMTDRLGRPIRTDGEIARPGQATIPLQDLASVALASPWWTFGRRPRLVLVARHPSTFDGLRGPDGLDPARPDRLILRLRPDDLTRARAWVVEVQLALGDLALGSLEPETWSGFDESEPRSE